jgi:dTDP-4-dehydrorhamnose reductase
MKVRVLITGATGMLGKDITDELAVDQGYEVVGLVRKRSDLPAGVRSMRCDLCDLDGLRSVLRDVEPDIVIHCAGIVNVDLCEKDRQTAEAVHVDATRVMADRGCTFVYISSDSVFDGRRGKYGEEDPVNPLNHYARSKRRGEVAGLEVNPRTCVLRTNIYGFHRPRGSSLAEWALDKLRAQQPIDGFDDVYFNPLYTKQVARLVRGNFMQGDHPGIWNLACDKTLSKYEFLVLLASAFSLPATMVQATSVESARFEAPRPKNTTLRTDKVRKLIGAVPSFQEGLAEFCYDYQHEIDEVMP